MIRFTPWIFILAAVWVLVSASAATETARWLDEATVRDRLSDYCSIALSRYSNITQIRLSDDDRDNRGLDLAEYLYAITEILERFNSSLWAANAATACRNDQWPTTLDLRPEYDSVWRQSFETAFCQGSCVVGNATASSNVFAENEATASPDCCGGVLTTTSTVTVDKKPQIQLVCDGIQAAIVEQCGNRNNSDASSDSVSTTMESPAVAAAASQPPSASPSFFSIKLSTQSPAPTDFSVSVADDTGKNDTDAAADAPEAEQLIEITRSPVSTSNTPTTVPTTQVSTAYPTSASLATPLPTTAPAAQVAVSSTAPSLFPPSVLQIVTSTSPSFEGGSEAIATDRGSAVEEPSETSSDGGGGGCKGLCQQYLLIVVPAAVAVLSLAFIGIVWYDRRQHKNRFRGSAFQRSGLKVSSTEHSRDDDDHDDDSMEQGSVFSIPSTLLECRSVSSSAVDSVVSVQSLPLSPNSSRRLHDLLETFQLETLTDADISAHSRKSAKSTKTDEELPEQPLQRVSRSRLQHERARTAVAAMDRISLSRSISLGSEEIVVFDDNDDDDASCNISCQSDCTPVVKNKRNFA